MDSSRTDKKPKRWRPLAIAVAVAVNLVVVSFVVRGALSSEPDGTATATPSSPTGAASSPTTGSRPSDTATLEPTDAPGVEAAVQVTATPDSEGFVAVIERVTPANPIRQLTLEPPPALSPNDAPPQVLALTLHADGKQVDVPATTSRDYLVLLPAPATSVVLHYRLSGVISRDPDAPDGRALVQLRPLTSSTMETATAVIELAGVRVRNLVCPDLPVADRLCARLRGDGWRTASMANKDATVVAQIDLPGVSPQT